MATQKTLLQKIKAFLNITDEGRIEHFLQKQTKSLTREISAANKNIESENFNYNNELEQLNEQLEDAQIEVQSAYMSVTPDDVKTNADQDSFSHTYWSKIEAAERAVKNIEKQIAKLTESHEETLKGFNTHIEECQRRINMIS